MEFTYLVPAKISPLAQWFCTQTLHGEVKTNLLRNRAAGGRVSANGYDRPASTLWVLGSGPCSGCAFCTGCSISSAFLVSLLQ